MRPSIHWPGGDALAAAWGLPLVERHEVVDSTQDRALALARAGASPWTAVLAHEQTMGRGRRGREWRSRRGLGIWVSLVIPPAVDTLDSPAELPLTLRLGVAVADVVALAVPAALVQLKWPNDVWLNNRKVAGILAERVGQHTIAGIGLNLLHASDDFDEAIRDRVTSLSLDGWNGDPVALGGTMIKEIRDAMGRPAGEVLRALRARDALLDKELICPDGRVAQGAGFDEHGALRVRAGDDEWRISAGTIQLTPAAEAARG